MLHDDMRIFIHSFIAERIKKEQQLTKSKKWHSGEEEELRDDLHDDDDK